MRPKRLLTIDAYDSFSPFPLRQWAYPLILIGNPPIYGVINSVDVAKNIGR